MTQQENQHQIGQKELEDLLQEAGVWLGTKPTSRRTDEARVKEYLDSENYAASVVESGFADHGSTITIADDYETVYLLHKPTRSLNTVARDMVQTTSISKPRYSLDSLEEDEDKVTLRYRKGENQYEKKTRVNTETKTVQETRTRFEDVE